MNTAFDAKLPERFIKLSAREAFYHAKAALNTVDHATDDGVRMFLGDIPEPDFVFLTNTLPSKR